MIVNQIYIYIYIKLYIYLYVYLSISIDLDVERYTLKDKERKTEETVLAARKQMDGE